MAAVVEQGGNAQGSERGAGFAEKMAVRFFPQVKQGVSFRAAIEELYDSPARLAASAALHLLGWIGAGGGTFIAFRLVGGQINLVNAVALGRSIRFQRAIHCSLMLNRGIA